MVVLFGGLGIENHIVSLRVVIEKLLKSIEVKLVLDIIDIDFAVEMVVLEIAIPGNPTFVRIVLILAV
jgi:hypothetical protein